MVHHRGRFWCEILFSNNPMSPTRIRLSCLCSSLNSVPARSNSGLLAVAPPSSSTNWRSSANWFPSFVGHSIFLVSQPLFWFLSVQWLGQVILLTSETKVSRLSSILLYCLHLKGILFPVSHFPGTSLLFRTCKGLAIVAYCLIYCR